MIEILIISFIWWQVLSAAVVSAGYHRYFAHRAFTAPVWYEYLVLILGPLSGAGHVLGWVGVHRLHHNHSDTKDDPHSPKFQGWWRVLTSTFHVPPIKRKHVSDLLQNPRVVRFYKIHLEMRLLALVGGLVVLPFNWYVALILMPVVYGYIGFGLLNTLCHSKDHVTISALVNIFTGGDGWHANHHKRPRSWKIGWEWYQWDPGARFIGWIKT